MKFIQKYSPIAFIRVCLMVVPALFGLSGNVSLAQPGTNLAPPEFRAFPTAKSHTIFIRTGRANALATDGVALATGDWIGAFYYDYTSNRWICGGSVRYDLAKPTLVLTVYGSDAMLRLPGFTPDSVFKFVVAKRQTNNFCHILNARPVFKSPGGLITNTGRFVKNGISELDSLIGTSPTLAYNDNNYCQTDTRLIVPIAKLLANAGGSLKFSGDAGLKISSTTGEVKLDSSTPGNHVIHVEPSTSNQFETCFTLDSFTIHIDTEPEFNFNPYPGIICANDSVTIYPIFTNPNVQPVSYKWTRLRLGGNQTINSNKTITVGPGRYVLMVQAGACSFSDTTQFIGTYQSFKPVITSTVSCEGIFLKASSSDPHKPNYSWSNGDTGTTTLVKTSQLIKLTAQSVYGCLTDTSLPTSWNPLNINPKNLILNISNAKCDSAGSITVNLKNVTGGYPPYKFELVDRNSHTRIAPAKSIFKGLPEGTYDLLVTDSLGCSFPYLEPIAISRPSDCQRDILTPNGDGRDDSFYIPDAATIRIFDRNGTQRRQLVGPTSWDGTDNNGQPLPMGLYIIVAGNRQTQLTVIR